MAIGEEINHLNQIVIDAFRNKSLAQACPGFSLAAVSRQDD